MSHADDVVAYAAYLNARHRAVNEYDGDEWHEFLDDLAKAHAAMTLSWLEQEHAPRV